MTELRSHLSTLRRRYETSYYPGDLVADLRRSTFSPPRWLGALGISTGALAAGVALFLALDASQVLPWEPAAANAAPSAIVSVPLTFPSRPDQSGGFNIVPSFQVFGSPASPADEKAPAPSTSQESA